MNKAPSSSQPCIYALTYHSISNADVDPWSICISPCHFEEQIKFLKKHFHLICINEIIHQLSARNITQNSVCITFDDGYGDNYLYGKPILEKYKCPAAFFIPTAFTGINKPFWWDALEYIFLQKNKLPGKLCLHIHGNDYRYFFATELTEQQWLQHTQWKWYNQPPTDRCRAFLDIWNKLRPLLNCDIEKQMDYLNHWAGINNESFKHRLPMNSRQLQHLSGNDLFTIGLHTHTHSDLQAADKHTQFSEINLNKEELFNRYHIQANCMAYPYGRFNNHTLQVAGQLKIAACFTTEAANITIHSCKRRLGRLQVTNDGVNQFNNLFNGLK